MADELDFVTLREEAARRALGSEEEEEDGGLMEQFRQRVSAPPARTQTQSRGAPRVQASTPTDGNVPRSDLTPEFNQELREAYKEGPQSRGERYFDQRQGSSDFERLHRFNEEAPRRVKKIDPNEPPHESRRLHREMRARTKGGQFVTEQQLRDYIRLVEQGYEAGGGRTSARTMAKRAAKAAFRRSPIVAAGAAGYALGDALSPAARRNRERAERAELYESRQERIKDLFPGRSGDFYRGMAREMMREDAEGYAPDQQSLDDTLRLMELEREQIGIRERNAERGSGE